MLWGPQPGAGFTSSDVEPWLPFDRTPYEEWQVVCLGNPEQIAGQIREFQAIGFGTLIADMPAPHDLETLERLIGEVKPLVEA